LSHSTTVFTKNRNRLLNTEMSHKVIASIPTHTAFDLLQDRDELFTRTFNLLHQRQLPHTLPYSPN
jgi:hypothetical protein